MSELLVASILLIALCLASAFLYRNDILHPAFWANAVLSGYGVGGVFYHVYGVDRATFLNLAHFDQSRAPWLVAAIGLVFLGWLSANFGFTAANRHGGFRHLPKGGVLAAVDSGSKRTFICFAAASMVLGFVYWLYFASAVAGSVAGLFINVAAVPYLVAKVGITSLPIHFFYAGALLWLASYIPQASKAWVGLIFLPLGMLVILSFGRISAANAFALSGLLSFLFVVRGKVKWPIAVAALGVLMPLNIAFYFFRIYSSYRYIGRPDDFPLMQDIPTSLDIPTQDAPAGSPVGFGIYQRITYILENLIGGGNVPDLQQIVLIVSGLFDGRLGLTFGSTYFDWLRNLLNARIGVSGEEIHSVGYRILNAYFPDKIGGPTPGMIGEAILNFGPLFFVLVAALCYLVARVYLTISESSSVFAKILYCIFLLNFWALFIKVDSSLVLDLIWAIGPFIALIMTALLADRGIAFLYARRRC